MQVPKLEELARELETVARGKKERGYDVDYTVILAVIRNDTASKQDKMNLLQANGLSYFAGRLSTGYYENNYEKYVAWLKENDTQEVRPASEESQS